MSPSGDSRLPRRWPADLLRLGWISLWMDVASEMSTPLIPLYLGTLAVAPALALGWIEGATRALHALLTALAGWRSDRVRARVPYVRWGYGLAVGSKAALALAGSWPVLLGLRLVDRFGKGLRTAPRDALIVEYAGGRRGAAFGLHRAMDTAGALVGVLLAALVLAFLPGRYRLVFALSALPGLFALGLALRLREPARTSDAGNVPSSPWASIRVLPRRCLVACALQWWLALATLSESFLVLRSSELGLGDASTLLLYALFNAVYAATALPAGRWSDAVGRRTLIGLGATLHAATLGLATQVEGAGVIGLFALFGLQQGLTQGAGKAWVSDRAPLELRATALGLLQLGNGMALLVGGVLAGWLWTERGPEVAFGVLAGVGAAGVVALALAGGSGAETVPSPRPPGEDAPRPRR